MYCNTNLYDKIQLKTHMTITEAGRQWGVSRSTIYAKIKD